MLSGQLRIPSSSRNSSGSTVSLAQIERALRNRSGGRVRFDKPRMLAAIALAINLASSTLSPVQGQQGSSSQAEIRLDNETITNTPAIDALCVSGTGDAQAYAAAASKLIAYTNVNSIKATGTAFSDTWSQGPDPKNPGNGAQWDVCIEAVKEEVVEAPYSFRTLQPKSAAYATCTVSADDLNKCFALLEASALKNKYYPAAPPRFKTDGAAGSGKHVFMIWLPVIPIPQAGSS